MLHIDRAKLNRMKAARKQALTEGKTRKDAIVIDGDEFVIAYLDYLIPYVESRLSDTGAAPNRH